MTDNQTTGLQNLPLDLREDAILMQERGMEPEARRALRAADEIERLRAALDQEAKFWERHGPGAGPL